MSVKVDQESQSWPKSQWLTKNGQRYDCKIIGLAVWEKYCENPLYGWDSINKL